MACPGIDALEEYLSDELDDDSSRWVEHHLVGCDGCKTVLHELKENRRMEPRVHAAYQAEQPAPDLAEGTLVGRYRLRKPLGRGGTGVVYEAEQANTGRRVAVKLLTPTWAGDRRTNRLMSREIRALGRLTHASIAAVFEAGTTEDGRAYFAMERVDGVPITTYARQKGLSVDMRVDLFCRVCDAVAHAHQRGVIHRDLKPSNILVDAYGTPKVLDFGLAKLLDVETEGPPSSMTPVSEIGRVAGTIPYMSPEQVRGDRDAVDVRSDVYTLGVVLYELLTGRLPYRIEAGNLPQSARVICEQAPQPPSRLVRELRGDAETILLKALTKDVAGRYQSVGELAADLRRFLRAQPILARPAGAWYQFRKFAQRNRALVASMAVSLVTLIGGTAAAVGQAYVATRQRDAAERRLAWAKQAANYVFAGVGSQISGVPGTGAIQRHLAEEAYVFYKRLADEHPDDVEAQTRLWAALARLARLSDQIGEHERARVLRQHVRDAAQRALEAWPEEPRVRHRLMLLDLADAVSAARKGDSATAVKLARRAEQTCQQVTAWYEDHLDWDDPRMGAVPEGGPNAGRTPDYILHRRDWSSIIAKTLGPALIEIDVGLAEDQCVEALRTIQELRQIDPTIEPIYLQDASEYAPMAPPILLRNGSGPSYDQSEAHVQLGLATIAARRGDFPAVEEHLRSAETIAARVVQKLPDHPAVIDLLATTQRRLGEQLLQSGDIETAREYAELALDGHRRLATADPDDPDWQKAVAADQRLLAEMDK